MASQAIQGCQDLGQIARIDQVRDRVTFHWMAEAILQRNDRHFAEVVLGQFYLAVEDAYQVFSLHLLRLGIGAMALKT